MFPLKKIVFYLVEELHDWRLARDLLELGVDVLGLEVFVEELLDLGQPAWEEKGKDDV